MSDNQQCAVALPEPHGALCNVLAATRSETITSTNRSSGSKWSHRKHDHVQLRAHPEQHGQEGNSMEKHWLRHLLLYGCDARILDALPLSFYITCGVAARYGRVRGCTLGHQPRLMGNRAGGSDSLALGDPWNFQETLRSRFCTSTTSQTLRTSQTPRHRNYSLFSVLERLARACEFLS